MLPSKTSGHVEVSAGAGVVAGAGGDLLEGLEILQALHVGPVRLELSDCRRHVLPPPLVDTEETT